MIFTQLNQITLSLIQSGFFTFSIQSKNRVTSVRVVKMESLRNKYSYNNFANSLNFQNDLSGFDLTSAASHGSYGGHS